MATGLYLLTSENLPELQQDEAEHLLVDVRDDADPPPAEPEEETVAATEYSCMTTLVTNCEDNEELHELVADWWRELAGVEPELELLADDLSLMSADQRASIADLKPEAWSIRTPLVLYRKGSSDARAEARRFLIESALETQ